MDFLSAIKSIAGEECIFCNEMMSDHTTFKVDRQNILWCLIGQRI